MPLSRPFVAMRRAAAPRVRQVVATAALLTCSAALAQACLVDDAEEAWSAEPMAWSGASCVTGGGADDRLWRTYLLDVTEPERRLELGAAIPDAEPIDLCIEVGGVEQCRRADGGVSLPDLVLAPGTYLVTLRAAVAPGDRYRLDLRDVGEARPGFEREPNDAVRVATPLDETGTVRGRLAGRDWDYFRLDVDRSAEVWRVEVAADEPVELRYHDAAGATMQVRRVGAGEGGGMRTIYLLPGSHYFSLVGTDADYELRFTRLGTEAEALGGRTGNVEREPNDDPSRAHLLRPDEPWFGLLAEVGDTDVYRFHLGEEAYARVTVTPPDGSTVDANVSGRLGFSASGAPAALEAWLPAGDHLVLLRSDGQSDEPYELLLELLDPFLLPDDLEPNDHPHEARPLPSDGVVEGAVGTHRDSDWFLVAALDAAAPVVARLEGERASLVTGVRDAGTGAVVADFELDRAEGVHRATLPAGGPYALSVTGLGDYRLEVVVGTDSAPAVRAGPPRVDVSLAAASESVAAYHALAQRVPVTVSLRNDGPAATTLELLTHVSDHRWLAELTEASVTLAAGETRAVPLTLTAMPHARDDLPVRLTVAARDEGGGSVTGAIELAAVCGAPTVDPLRAWTLPERLLGGLNVAWTALGSEVEDPGYRELLLYDGLTPPSGGIVAPPGTSTTVRLAGEPPPTVLGVLLHPLGDGPTAGKLADFRVSTSLDGATFVPVLDGRLRSILAEQAFVFGAGVTARYVRLELLSRQDGLPTGTINLGQFKVIAEPSSRPLGGAFDLADRSVGGFVARSSPHLTQYALTEARPGGPVVAALDADADTASFTIGFHHTRAALIDALEWRPHTDGQPGYRRFAVVEVSVTTDHALGPWRTVGEWRPHEQPTWRLPEPTWARFVRFEARDLEPGARVEYPAELRILEHPAGDDYRTVVGEWGHYEREAAFEWLHPPRVAAGGAPLPRAGGANGSRELALHVASGEEQDGLVAVGEYEAWYRVEIAPGDNHLRLDLRGDPIVAFAFELLDASGAPVDAEVASASDLVVVEAFVDPGTYHLRLWEPPRSVVFAWDNSGSMGPYLDAAYQAVVGFAADIVPGRDRVQLLPFDDVPTFLLREWSDDPGHVIAQLVSYDRSAASSDAEANLAFAVEQLAQRDGARAVVLVTDAESGAFPVATTALWHALEAARPRVFAFETSSGAADDTQDRMQSWAFGGFYDYSRTIGELERGLARASCMMRQPKAVRVAFRSAYVAPPGPGELVVRSLAPDDAGGAVLVIFDASGSMGKVLPDGGSTRVAAAREVLTELVERGIEPGTPFALRAYGHVQPTSCDSRLEIPLRPLDRGEAGRVIAAIEPKLLSGTPLARSIELAADDLAGASWPVRVVLLTDGEESCGGDPEAAIRALASSGVVAQFSIVAFDLDADDPAAATSRFERWAEIGGGRAFAASDAAGLRSALAESLVRAVAFEVLDGGGAIVASGVVDGDPVALPGGAYSVRVAGGGAPLDVRVAPDAQTTLTVDAP